MKRLAVIGTLVRDRIWHPAGSGDRPVEQWGGIAYSLAALSAGCPPGWTIRPIVRVGADLADSALELIAGFPNLEVEPGITIVPEPNNRVELRYRDADERTERLSGGVSGWSFAELEPLLAGVDALYVNFISGFEMEIGTAEALRSLGIPVYADLHSLFLGPPPVEGPRAPLAPGEWRRWLDAFDAVQMNEPEMELLVAAAGWARGSEPPGSAGAVECGPGAPARRDASQSFDASVEALAGFFHATDRDRERMAFITRGPRGAVCVRCAPGQSPEIIHIPLATPPSPGDPTGCGDIWGAITAVSLVAGYPPEEAVRRANAAAAARLGVARIDQLREAVSRVFE